MPGIFARINKARDARLKKKNAVNDLADSIPTRPKWDDAYTRDSVDPDEVDELIRCCTHEIKARGTPSSPLPCAALLTPVLPRLAARAMQLPVRCLD